ncbi:MAG: ABC transporter permease [Chlamydiales bacterium]
MNKNIQRLKALFIKEFLQIIRDPSTLLISVALPLFLLFLYGFGVSLDLNHLRMGLVMEDTSPEAITFAESVLNSRFLDVTIGRNRKEMEKLITEGKIRGFMVVPSYFSQFLKRKETIAPVQVIADGSETNTASFVQLYAQGVYQNYLLQEKMPSEIQIAPRYWYNEQLESRFFLLSGSLAIIMTLIGTLLTALVVSREWERGTMESIMSTPVTIIELVIGKLIPYFILGMVSMLICVAISVWVFGLPLRGSFFLLLFVSALFLLGSIGIGLLISTVAKNQIIAYQISLVIGFLPAYILSGFLFEIASMPKWIQILTYFIPARYFVQSLQTLFLVGNIWELVIYDSIFLLLTAVVFFGITAFKTKKRLD